MEQATPSDSAAQLRIRKRRAFIPFLFISQTTRGQEHGFRIMRRKRTVAILGTRGVPALHGGFETFAERLALWLVRRGWQVVVYCQFEGDGQITQDEWRGITRILVPTAMSGARGTIQFDWRCIRHVAQTGGRTVLTLGYNTALFCLWLRVQGVRNVINMDGLEWQRKKWRWHERAWLWVNERAGCLFGNHLIADHPRIADHLASRARRRKITMIPYGADAVSDVGHEPLSSYGVKPGEYSCVIARPEPENSILEIVQAFSTKPRKHKLLVFGKFEPGHAFHDEVRRVASEDVCFVGPIYDRVTVDALRYHCRLYVHGHQVGGTNPSLVEALGAGSAILAHDNRFNRWVAGDAAVYFSTVEACAHCFDMLLEDDHQISKQRLMARERHSEAFLWPKLLNAYEEVLFEHQ